MTAISLASTPPTAPRLEFYQDGSNELQRITVERSPFRIGRCETCDLRIDSVQVSREHAQLYQRGNIWTIRDLGSTNGTQVNGKPVRESFLSDGDILTIAETEVTFVASSVTPFQRMATQPIQSREVLKRPALLPCEIAQARALAEATLWQAVPLDVVTIFSLETGEPEACLAQLADAAGAGDPDWQSGSYAAAGRHYRALARRLAVEMADSPIAANRLLLTADVADFQSPEPLRGELAQFRDALPADTELGVTISLRRILDLAPLDAACRQIRDAELLLALVGFQGSSGQVAELESHAPDYLVLSDSMLKGVTASGQPLRRLELVLTTCQQLGIKAVLPECGCQRTTAQCRQLGYEFTIGAPQAHEAAEHRDAVAVAG